MNLINITLQALRTFDQNDLALIQRIADLSQARNSLQLSPQAVRLQQAT